MKMKRKYWGFIMLGFILAIGGCSHGGAETEKQNTEIQSSDSSEGITEGTGSEEHPGAAFLEEKINLADYSLEYQADTDAQPWFAWTSVTSSENGYYLWGPGQGLMMFYDPAAGRLIPLCNRPDCLHNNSECNAFFNAFRSDGDQYARSYVQFYEGNLYVIALDEEDYVNLYKVSPDGSSCEKYMQLYRADLSRVTDGDSVSTEFRSPYVCIHRGYVYFIINDEKQFKIRRIKLGTSDVEIIYEQPGERGNIYRMEAYGDYLFFQAGNFINEEYVEIEGGIYAYNIETGSIQLVKKDAIRTYIIADGVIYYSRDMDIYAFSLDSQEDNIVIKGAADMDDFSADESYIYILKEEALNVYNHKGELINQVEDDISGWSYGDGEYLFAEKYEGQERYILTMKVSQLEEENPTWNYMR